MYCQSNNNKMLIKLFIVVVCFIEINATVKTLPSYFPNCHRRNPNLSKCLIKAAEQVKPYLVKGVPELNIPSIEPLIIPEMILEQGTDALNFKTVLKNFTIHGMSKYTYSQFNFDPSNLKFSGKAHVEPLQLHGDYTIDGKLLVAPIKGAGKFTGSIGHSNITFYQSLKEVTKKGEIYLESVVINTTIKAGQPKVHLEGLFDGNSELNKLTNKVIEDNAEELFEEVRPVMENVITKVMENLLLNAFFNNVPYNKLFPDIP